jgi:hypothetical protein
MRGKTETSPPESRKSAIADLYTIWTLNCIIDLAQLMALDFVWRPTRYQLLDERAAALLTSFRTLVGRDPDWPGRFQRIMVLYPYFGRSAIVTAASDRSQFQRLGSQMRYSASLVVERSASGAQREALVRPFMSSVQALSLFLQQQNGRALASSAPQVASIFRSASELFGNESVAAAFGRPATSDDWLLRGVDQRGAEIVYAVSVGLGLRVGSRVLKERFTALHKVALDGHTLLETLDRIAPDEVERNSDRLLLMAYEWLASIRALRATESLTPFARAAPTRVRGRATVVRPRT